VVKAEYIPQTCLDSPLVFPIASKAMAKTEDVFAKLAELQKLQKQAIRTLLKERRALDRRLAKLGHTGGAPMRKAGKRTCKTCGKTGHNSRTCPMKGKKG
jgi:hypothetical protein